MATPVYVMCDGMPWDVETILKREGRVDIHGQPVALSASSSVRVKDVIRVIDSICDLRKRFTVVNAVGDDLTA